jgi:hypothetical protein
MGMRDSGVKLTMSWGTSKNCTESMALNLCFCSLFARVNFHGLKIVRLINLLLKYRVVFDVLDFVLRGLPGADLADVDFNDAD